MCRFISAIFCLVIFSCGTGNVSFDIPISDTAKVLNEALLIGTDVRNMPSASGLKGVLHLGDTILLTSQILPVSVLPKQVDGQQFKVMSQKELCAAMKPSMDIEPTPKYLNISQFEKNDSGYYIQLQSISCGEFASGGSLGLYFKKVKDSFLVVDRQASSIN